MSPYHRNPASKRTSRGKIPRELADAARGKRLQKLHDKIPGKKLATMRMAGQLQVKTGFRGRKSRSRLMREQHFYGRLFGRANQSRNRIAAMRRIEMMRTEVGDPGHHNCLADVLENDMLVYEHRQAETAHFSNPGMCTGVILMIPGDEESAEARG